MIQISKKYREQRWGANLETFCDTAASKYENDNFVENINYKDNRLNGDVYLVNGKEVSKDVYFSIITKEQADAI